MLMESRWSVMRMEAGGCTLSTLVKWAFRLQE